MFVDLDDTIIEVHGYGKQGAGFGYSGVRGLNALLATASTTVVGAGGPRPTAPQGRAGSPKGAARIVADALATLRRLDRHGDRPGAGARGLRVLRARHHRHRDPGRRGRVGHRPDGPRREGRDRDDPRRCVDDDRVPGRDPRRDHRAVDLPRRSRRDPVHRVPVQEEGRAGRRAAGRAPHPRPEPETRRSSRRCSTRGGTTRSSPPPTPKSWTPSPRTRPTAATRSSSKSTPTSRTGRSRTCRPGCSPRTAPGSSSP